MDFPPGHRNHAAFRAPSIHQPLREFDSGKIAPLVGAKKFPFHNFFIYRLPQISPFAALSFDDDRAGFDRAVVFGSWDAASAPVVPGLRPGTVVLLFAPSAIDPRPGRVRSLRALRACKMALRQSVQSDRPAAGQRFWVAHSLPGLD